MALSAATKFAFAACPYLFWEAKQKKKREKSKKLNWWDYEHFGLNSWR
jgi:hypothetical protein